MGTRGSGKKRGGPVRSALLLLLGIASAGAAPGPLAGQGGFAFQIRGGRTLSLADFRSEDEGWEGRAGGGNALAMGFTFPLPGPLGAYVGFGQYRFACDEDVCPAGKDWISTGFDVALRAVLGQARIRSWLQAGFHNHRVHGRVLEGRGVRTTTSDGGGGFEVGGGLLIRIGQRTSLAPGVRYGEGNVPFPLDGRMRLRYLVADLGVLVGF